MSRATPGCTQFTLFTGRVLGTSALFLEGAAAFSQPPHNPNGVEPRLYSVLDYFVTRTDY